MRLPLPAAILLPAFLAGCGSTWDGTAEFFGASRPGLHVKALDDLHDPKDYRHRPDVPGTLADCLEEILELADAEYDDPRDSAGAVFVLAAAVMMLLTLENALNQMWSVRKPRPLLRRIGLYLLLLAAGPVLLGAGLWASASLFGASMSQMRSLPPWLAFALELGPVALCSAALAIAFHVLPNAPVRWLHAIVSGVLGGIALELGKRAFAAYLIHGPIYQSLYGALATLPVFVLWVYFSCVVTLSAALVAAHLGPVPRGRAAGGGARSKFARARA
jgi:YihY family inner membrane protein